MRPCRNRQAMTEPSLTVVVPSVNGLGDLMDCLVALSRQRTDVDLEVLVVDRCGEPLRAEVRKTHPWVRVLEAPAATTIPDLRALPATMLFLTAWSIGEGVGYLRGPADVPAPKPAGDD